MVTPFTQKEFAHLEHGDVRISCVCDIFTINTLHYILFYLRSFKKIQECYINVDTTTIHKWDFISRHQILVTQCSHVHFGLLSSYISAPENKRMLGR